MRITQEEFREIYKQYFRLVMKVANEKVKDINYAQDICQEVFLRFAEKVDELDLSRCGEWFAVNARRKGIDYTRKAFRKHESIALSEFEGEDTGTYAEMAAVRLPGKQYGTGDLSNQSVVKEFTGKLFEDLERKEPDWYEIAVRMYVYGEEDREIAGSLGLTIGALRTKRHRMKKWIMENYREEYESLP